MFPLICRRHPEHCLDLLEYPNSCDHKYGTWPFPFAGAEQPFHSMWRMEETPISGESSIKVYQPSLWEAATLASIESVE